MEWSIMNGEGLQGPCSSLGWFVEDKYCIGDEGLVALEEIYRKLCSEDKILRTIRRALGYAHLVQRDLIPILLHIQDDHKIYQITLKLLVSLTIPVECLIPVEVASKRPNGKTTVEELQTFLAEFKKSFIDSNVTKSLLEMIKRTIEKEHTLKNDDCELINNCLILLRNVLHIPEISPTDMNSTSIQNPLQNQILWNLFSQGMDKVLIIVMTSKQSVYWAATMVQLIALIYKDQHIGTLQKLLSTWLEASTSESSEDNESNTSPHDDSGYSPITSDSSDTPMESSNPTNRKIYHALPSELPAHLNNQEQEMKDSPCPSLESSTISACPCPSQLPSVTHCKPSTSKGVPHKQHGNSSPKRLNSSLDDASSNFKKTETHGSSFDFGYGSQETQENTSSNDDDGMEVQKGCRVHVLCKHKNGSGCKPRPKTLPSTMEIDDTRKRKLSPRQKCHLKKNKAWQLKQKGLKHVPSDDDISNLLREFTIDFLIRGYGILVTDLKGQLTQISHAQIDQSHFLWLITYFLKFATQLHLEFRYIEMVISYEVLSFLLYEGINTFEQLELMWNDKHTDFKPYLRRLHLVIAAIHEFIETLETYAKCSSLSQEDKETICQIQNQFTSINDLRQIFLFLIRHHNPNMQSKQYLQDIITTNHVFLLSLEQAVNKEGSTAKFDMLTHIKQFGTQNVMKHYGRILEDFWINSEFVNDCVFTMMHHVAGDIRSPETLFQPTILKTFSKIWEQEYEVLDDWADLMEYIMNKFMTTVQQNPAACVSHLFGEFADDASEVTDSHINYDDCWSEEDLENLYFYFIQCELLPDPVGRIAELYAENSITKTRQEILQQLQLHSLITSSQANILLEKERKYCSSSADVENKSSDLNSKDFQENENDENTSDSSDADEVSQLIEKLKLDGRQIHLQWLQNLLLESCYVKLHRTLDRRRSTPEPIPFYYIMMNQSIPIIPFNEEQEKVIRQEEFVMLLHKLGFHLPADVGRIFPRIPCFWTPDVLYATAKKLSPISPEQLKFDVSSLNDQFETQPMNEIGMMMFGGEVPSFPRIDMPSRIGQTSTRTVAPTANWLSLMNYSKVLNRSEHSTLQLLSPVSPSSADANADSDNNSSKSADSDEFKSGESFDNQKQQSVSDDDSTCIRMQACTMECESTGLCLSKSKENPNSHFCSLEMECDSILQQFSAVSEPIIIGEKHKNNSISETKSATCHFSCNNSDENIVSVMEYEAHLSSNTS